MEQQNIEQLFQRYLNNICTEEEINVLLQYFDAGDNEALLKSCILQQLQSGHQQKAIECSDWHPLLEDAFKKIKEKIAAEETASTSTVFAYKRQWFHIAAAAAILVFMFTTLFLLVNYKQEPGVAINKSIPALLNDIAPGHDNAILTLADGTTIVLDNTANGALARQGNTNVFKLNNQIVYNKTANGAESKAVYNTIATARGNQFQLVLADGSKVWLNAASSIRFPTAFTGKVRRVEITGEAYFEVTKSPSKPFKVVINAATKDVAEVEVLGTHFNINAYADEPDVKTTLLEGAVKVKKGNTVQVLSPGQQAILATNEIFLRKDVDLSLVMAWKEGYFWFDNTDVRTLMRQVERWYDVDVRFEGKITEEGFTGKISRKVTLSKFLKVLELNDIHIKMEGRKITITP